MPTFSIGNIELEYLYHQYNCGTGRHRTERTIEIPIALYWLDRINTPIEVGAVLPYYKNNLIHDVIDPVDPKATIKKSLFDCDLRDKDVISVSTIEHVGTGEYSYSENGVNASLAFDYISRDSDKYIITFPYGCSNILDKRLVENGFNCNVYMLSRQKNEEWVQVNYKGLLPYGRCEANSVIVLENGGMFN